MSERQNATNEVKLYIPCDAKVIEATVTLPDDPRGIVVFADGTHASTFLNFEKLAGVLHGHRFATVVADLLHEKEARPGQNCRTSTALLRSRLSQLLFEIERRPNLAHLPLGIMCAGGAVKATLFLASHEHAAPRALVFYDGNLLEAAEDVPWIDVPTLFIFASTDPRFDEANKLARETMVLATTKMVELMPGDPFEKLSNEVTAWFETFLSGTRKRPFK